jgi:naphthoate synthase
MGGVSELFDPELWEPVAGFEQLADITYHLDRAGQVARIAFDRPEVRNAFRPQTVDELYRALDHARQNPRVGVVLLTGNGPSPADGVWAFCSGGDQRVRGRAGYEYSESAGRVADGVGESRPGFDTAASPPTQPATVVGRLHILEV